MSKNIQVIEVENWSTIELFNYLIITKTISDDESFEAWKNDRSDMLKYCKANIENYGM